MKNPGENLLLVAAILFYSTTAQAQQDSLKMDSLIALKTISIRSGKQDAYLEVYKLRSKRTFKLVKNQQVRVYSFKTKTGRVKTKSAIISEINDHEITFKPISKRFDEITYTDTCMTYIEIVTAGGVIRGIVINALLTSLVVITVGVIVIGSWLIFTGGGHLVSGSGGGLGRFIAFLPWDNFHKHIRFIDHRGIQKWGARVVGS